VEVSGTSTFQEGAGNSAPFLTKERFNMKILGLMLTVSLLTFASCNDLFETGEEEIIDRKEVILAFNNSENLKAVVKIYHATPKEDSTFVETIPAGQTVDVKWKWGQDIFYNYVFSIEGISISYSPQDSQIVYDGAITTISIPSLYSQIGADGSKKFNNDIYIAIYSEYGSQVRLIQTPSSFQDPIDPADPDNSNNRLSNIINRGETKIYKTSATDLSTYKLQTIGGGENYEFPSTTLEKGNIYSFKLEGTKPNVQVSLVSTTPIAYNSIK
jgi:hypothetical protein